MTRRRTKIVCTLGPATNTHDGIADLMRAGMNVVRLNFSHGDREEHRETIRRIREVARDTGVEVGILQDLGGPKIRLGVLPNDGVELIAHQSIELSVEGAAVDDSLPVNYAHLLEDVKVGETILLADGAAELEVVEVRTDRLVCKVINGGFVSTRKGVNLPNADLQVPAVTEKDIADLEVGLEEGVDFVALSFVRHENDLFEVRKRIQGIDHPPLLIAKIEKPQAVDRLDPIIDAVDGIMVARGDLGVEMPPEKVPMIQKRIIEAARRAGRPVITATQMLRSMVDSPRPLRAEASDVANAIFDGTDALMLSEETAIGHYPNEAVRMLAKVARETEPYLDVDDLAEHPSPTAAVDVTGAVSRGACRLAAAVRAAAIVTTTTTGNTARLIARHRPQTPILGVTTSVAIARQLNLSWGVIPTATEGTTDLSDLGNVVLNELSSHRLAARGDHVVIAAGLPLGFSDSANLLQIRKLE